jgi:NAD(P)H-hydrate epimerase
VEVLPTKIRYLTDTGIEVPAVTADEVREIDRIATEETGPNLFQMMENAGRSLALFAIELLGRGWKKADILVFAGGGGNGGGGICAARHLANRNVNARLCLSNPDHMSDVAQWQRKIFVSAGGTEVSLAEVSRQQPHMILDALIGYGLRSAPSAQVTQMIEWANDRGSSILALDIPSGLDATTGDSRGATIRPRWTMTLALPKTGLLPGKTGDLYLADVGIPKVTYQRMRLHYETPFESRFYIPLKQQLR